MRPLNRLTIPWVGGNPGGVTRCLMPKVSAGLVKLVRAGCRALAQAEQKVGERLAARYRAWTNGAFNVSCGQDGADADRAGALEVAQETPGTGPPSWP